MIQENPSANKKIRILDAALSAYARYGIHHATTRQIAELAGIGKSTIFEYFKSSNELMDAAFAYLIEHAAKERSELLCVAEADPAAALSAYFDCLTRMIIDEPDRLLLLSQYVTAILASGTDFETVRERYAQLLQPAAQALLGGFQSIVERGIATDAFHLLPGIDAADCALLISAIAREMQSQALVQSEHEIKDTCRRLKGMAMYALGIKQDPIKEG